jgi:hypothetical protein
VPGPVVLHIGFPKTGTTALQEALQARRTELAALGVDYPGDGLAHHYELAAVIGLEALAGIADGHERWEAFVTHVTRNADTVLVSNEGLIMADDDAARRVVAGLGAERIRVHITLRPLAHLVASLWQERLKTGETSTLDEWSQDAARGPDAIRDHFSPYWLQADVPGVLQRWSRIVDPQRCTVQIVDTRRPDDLYRDFERATGLPSGILGTTPTVRSNRSLTTQEAERVRLRNIADLEADPTTDLSYRRPAVEWIVDMISRPPDPADDPLLLTAETLHALVPHLVAARDAVIGSGMRIYGDVDHLLDLPPSRPAPAADQSE